MTEPPKYTSCSDGRQSHFLAEFGTKSSVCLAAAIQLTAGSGLSGKCKLIKTSGRMSRASPRRKKRKAARRKRATAVEPSWVHWLNGKLVGNCH